MTQLSDDIRKCLHNDYYDCLFTAAIQRMVQRKTSMSSRIPNATVQLEKDLVDDPINFWKEPARSNLLTFLYWCKGTNEAQKLEEQNDMTLNHFSDNVAALTMKLRLLMNQDKPEEAKITATKLARFCEDHPLSVLQCEGEVAFALYYLGPTFFGEAIHRYRRVFAKYNDWMNGQDDDLMKTVPEDFSHDLCSWHFHFAHCYFRFLQIKKEVTGKGLANGELYDEIRSHLDFVIESDNQFYKGKAMIELVAINSQRERVPYSRARGETGLNKMREPLDVAPNDKFVWERFARQLVQPPWKEDLLREALQMLEPFERSGFAWQYKARAYVFLELLATQRNSWGRFDEDFCRAGNTDRKVSLHGKCSCHTANGSLSGESCFLHKAKNCYEQAIRLADGVFFNYVDLARTCTSLDELDEAEKNFNEAERLMKLYPGDVYEANISYIYYHWALLRVKQADQMSQNDKKLKLMDFRIMARKSVTAAMTDEYNVSKLLGMLCDDLSTMSQASHNKTAQLESELLKQVMKQYKFSKRPLVSAAEESPNIRQAIRQLVKTLIQNNSANSETSQEDSLTAFLYLTVMWKAKMLDMTWKSDVQKVLEIVRWLLNDDEQQQPIFVTNEKGSVESTITFNFPVRDMFRWIIGCETMSARGFRIKSKAQSISGGAFIAEGENTDVCLVPLTLFQSGDSGYASAPVYKKLLATLQGYLGLIVTSFGPADVGIGTEFDGRVDYEPNWVKFDGELNEAIGQSRSVLLIILNECNELSKPVAAGVSSRECQQQNWHERLTETLRALSEVKQAKVCVVICESGCNVSFEPISTRLQRWPRLELPDNAEITHQDLVRLLINKLALVQQR